MTENQLKQIALKFTVDTVGADGLVTSDTLLSDLLVKFFTTVSKFEEQRGEKVFISSLGTSIYSLKDKVHLHGCPVCCEFTIPEYVEMCPKCLTEITWDKDEQ